MARQRNHTPEIKYVAPPPIVMYQVSGDQLDRIKEECSQVGHDLSFALAAGGSGLTTVTTLLTVPQLTDKQQGLFLVLSIALGLVFLYTGVRWFWARRKAPAIIDSIRRSDQPENTIEDSET
ncbi:MAG: hypothetical protein AABZ53_08115 [Planctomycetota bacterium]